MMIEASTLVSIISLLFAAAMLIVNLTNSRRSRRSDDKQEATELTTLLVKLENISTGVNEIKSDMRNMRTDVQELQGRVIIAEQSLKSLHHRVDKIEGRSDSSD